MWSQVIMGWGQMEEVALFVISHGLYTWQFGKEVC